MSSVEHHKLSHYRVHSVEGPGRQEYVVALCPKNRSKHQEGPYFIYLDPIFFLNLSLILKSPDIIETQSPQPNQDGTRLRYYRNGFIRDLVDLDPPVKIPSNWSAWIGHTVIIIVNFPPDPTNDFYCKLYGAEATTVTYYFQNNRR